MSRKKRTKGGKIVNNFSGDEFGRARKNAFFDQSKCRERQVFYAIAARSFLNRVSVPASRC
ncbi:MAG TPA: hypothetical protein VGT08_05955 [Terracidiphilus sp.]|nr:hypothetical protein [Terracidiphilus sp.]